MMNKSQNKRYINKEITQVENHWYRVQQPTDFASVTDTPKIGMFSNNKLTRIVTAMALLARC